MRGISVSRVTVLAATLGALALLTAAGGARAQCVDVCNGTAQGQSFQLTFETFTPDCVDVCDTRGQTTALIGGALIPPNPIEPSSPSCKLAEGKLFLPGASDFFAIGRVIPPNPIRPTYLFDGHLVPASGSAPVIPPNPIIFRGRLFTPRPSC
jgi:hypothetical protein